MEILESQLSPSDPKFEENAAHNRALATELRAQLTTVRAGGGQKYLDTHKSRGKRFVRERIDLLLDPGSPFLEFSPLAAWELYDGRAGWVGSWRLLRAVAAHLAATGAVSATDDLLGPLVGGGVLGKLSRRFGEATVNAALTARVGVAAIEVCRPLPFTARPAPKARKIVLAALQGWRGEAKEG